MKENLTSTPLKLKQPQSSGSPREKIYGVSSHIRQHVDAEALLAAKKAKKQLQTAPASGNETVNISATPEVTTVKDDKEIEWLIYGLDHD